MNLEGNVLSEIFNTEKDKYRSLMWQHPIIIPGIQESNARVSQDCGQPGSL
jgi:hypothetical protein